MKLHVCLLVAILVGASPAIAQVDSTEIDFSKPCSFTLKKNNGWDNDPVYFIQLCVKESTQHVGIARTINDDNGRPYDSGPQELRTATLTINGPVASLVVGSLDLNLGRYTTEKSWQGEFASGRWEFNSDHKGPDKKVAYAIHDWKPEAAIEAERLWASHSADEAKAKEQWDVIRSPIEKLKSDGHPIQFIRAVEGGNVDWTWRDHQLLNNNDTRVIDHSRIGELNVFQIVPNIVLEETVDPATWTSLKELRHIGKLRIEKSAGCDLSLLADGPRIDSLVVVNANSQTIEGIAALRRLVALEIWFQQGHTRAPSPFSIKPLTRLTALEHLKLWNVPEDTRDILVGIHDLRSVKSLLVSGVIGERSLRSVSRLMHLEDLDCLVDSPELVSQITNPKLRTLRFASSSWPREMDDECLLAWDMPATIQKLTLRGFWTPLGALDYARKLSQMPIEKRQVYAKVRSLPELRTMQSDLKRLRNLEIAVGGGLIDRVVDPHKPTARRQVIRTLQLIEFNQDRLETVIPQLAKSTLMEAKTLLDQEKLSAEEMVAVIDRLATYYDEDDEEVWRILYPESEPQDDKAAQILNAAIDAMGYSNVEASDQTYRASWEISRGKGSLSVTRNLFINLGSKRLSSVDSTYDFSERRRIESIRLTVNGDQALRTAYGQSSPVFADKAAYFAWNQLDLAPQMVACLARNPERLRYGGKYVVDGRTIERIQLLWQKKVTHEFDFDARTHLLVERRQHQTEAQKQMFEGKYASNGDFQWKYENYERHAGLMMPMTVTAYDPIGVSTEVSQCTAFELAPEGTEDVFTIRK